MNLSSTEATVHSSRNRRGRTTSVTSAHITNSSSKAHGSPCTGAGYHWSIHPACLGNFSIKKARHAVQQFQKMEKLGRVYQQQRQLHAATTEAATAAPSHTDENRVGNKWTKRQYGRHYEQPRIGLTPPSVLCDS